MKIEQEELERIARENIYLPPAWRWDRIVELNGISASPTRIDDKHIPDGLDFCQRIERADTQSRRQRINLKYPALFVAFEIYGANDIVKWQTEALISAPKSLNGEIAEYIGTSERVIDAYELYFFDIRGRLGSPGYVAKHLFAPAIEAELDRFDRDFLWKLVGYYGGKEVLYGLWSAGKLDPEIQAFFRDDTTAKLDKDAFRAGYVREVNKYSAAEIVTQWTTHRELDVQIAAIEGGGLGGTTHLDTAKELIRAIHFSVARVDTTVFVDGERAELRASEMIAALPAPSESKKIEE